MRIIDWSSDVCSSDLPNFERRRYSPWRGYGQSKLANVMFMLELERRFRRHDLRAISVGAHPGFSATNIAASVPFANWPPMHRMFARSEEHTSELQSLMRISYAVFCLKKKK